MDLTYDTPRRDGDSGAERREFPGPGQYAIALIYRRHHDALLRFLRGRVADDAQAREIAQESYLRLCRQESIDHIAGREKSYLFQTATNLVRDLRRREEVRSRPYVRRSVSTADAAPPTPLEEVACKETIQIVRATLLSMNSRYREVFLASRVEGLTYSEIAARQGVSERTVERRMQRALGDLKRALLRRADQGSGGCP